MILDAWRGTLGCGFLNKTSLHTNYLKLNAYLANVSRGLGFFWWRRTAQIFHLKINIYLQANHCTTKKVLTTDKEFCDWIKPFLDFLDFWWFFVVTFSTPYFSVWHFCYYDYGALLHDQKCQNAENSEFIKTTLFAPSRERIREIRSSEEELEIEIPRVTSMLHLFHGMTFAPSVISVIKSFSKFLASLSSVWNWDQELWDGGQAVEERHDYIMW